MWAVEYLRPVHRGEVAVHADPEAQFRFSGVEAPGDAVDAESLLVPVVGGREEGAGASVGMELCDHPCGRHVGEGRCGSGLRGHHHPVGTPVPADCEEPFGVGVVLEPAQSQLEQLRRVSRAVSD